MTARDWIALVRSRGGVLSVRADELYVEPNVLTAAERERLEAVKLEVIATVAEEVPLVGLGISMSRGELLKLAAEAGHLLAVSNAQAAGLPPPAPPTPEIELRAIILRLSVLAMAVADHFAVDAAEAVEMGRLRARRLVLWDELGPVFAEALEAGPLRYIRDALGRCGRCGQVWHAGACGS